jgi:aminoglycoside phosphotransferase (APT) family kinase protein
MLSHLDAAPKNVLVGPEATVALLDFELGAAVSDPAYDPGFLAGHYLLMGENNPGMRAASLRAYKTLQDGYMKTAPYADVAAQGRMTRYAALTMLYRLYGSSPAPFLDPERYAAIREEGIRLLLSGEPKIK